MTDNISRLYELANIEATAIGCTNEDIQSPDYYSNDCEGDCIDCTWYDNDEVFPPFTNTKQLELIKLISSEFTVRINSNKDSTFIMLMQSAKTFLWASDDKFEQALAKLVCELWEYLKKEAKEEIRGILQ